MSYSYDKFLRPITSTDRNVQILDNSGIVQYTINPFSIVDILVSNNVLKINLRSKRVISIPFSTVNEAKLSISNLQAQLDTLKSKVPGYIDKQIENYVENQISLVDVDYGNGLVLSGGTVSVGGTLTDTLYLNGGNFDLIGVGFDNISMTSSVFDVVSEFISLDSSDTLQILSDNDLTLASFTGQISLAADSALVSIGNTQGLVYYTDYSSGFVTHSLVDKKYVDDAIDSVVGSNNELSEILTNGRDADSNGALNDNTSVQSLNLNLRTLKDSTGGVDSLNWENRVLYNSNGDATIDYENRNLYSDLSILSLNWKTGLLYNSSGVAIASWSASNNQGIQYLSDFTATFASYSLVHKDFVDNSISGATSSLVSYIDSLPTAGAVGVTNSFQINSGTGFDSFGIKNGDSILLNKTHTLEIDPVSTDNVFIGLDSGINNTGSYNVFVGKSSAESNTTGYSNVFVGYYSGYSNLTGLQNVYIGSNSGRASCGSNNVFLGSNTGYNNTTGSSNSFLGYNTGYCNTSGYNNTFIGQGAGYYNTSGYANTFVGQGSGLNNDACFNTFVGQQSGYYNTTGRFNVFMGNNSGYCNINGISNVFIGRNSGQVGTQSEYNTFIGDQSGFNNKACCNTFVGASTGFFNETGFGNSIFGMFSGYYNCTGFENTYIGSYTGYSGVGVTSNTFLGAFTGYQNIADNNTFIGHQSGYQNTSGSSNTFVGKNSGANVTEGCFNTIVGSYTGGGLITGNNNTIIGANVIVSSATESNIILADGQGNIKYHFDGSTNRLNDGLVVSGLTVLEEVTEVIDTSFNVTSSPTTYDFSTGANWYHSSASTNYTANFTNVPTIDSRAITVTIIISQGATAYVPNVVQINSLAQTIKWSGSSTGNANQTDIIGFTFIRVSGSWVVLGQINTFV